MTPLTVLLAARLANWDPSPQKVPPRALYALPPHTPKMVFRASSAAAKDSIVTLPELPSANQPPPVSCQIPTTPGLARAGQAGTLLGARRVAPRALLASIATHPDQLAARLVNLAQSQAMLLILAPLLASRAPLPLIQMMVNIVKIVTEMVNLVTKLGPFPAELQEPDTSRRKTAREKSNAKQENTPLAELTSVQFVQRVQPAGRERWAAPDALLVLPGVT